MNYKEEYKDCLDYIESYWDKVTYKPSRKALNRHTFQIPHPYIVPNQALFNSLFYWDSYFIFRGLMGTKRSYLMKKMVNNFIYLFNKYNVIPNSTSHGRANRSQPPFLTSMILDAYTSPHHHMKLREILEKALSRLHSYTQKRWLRHAMEVARKEYLLVWLDIESAYNHKVDGYQLARYGDRDVGYAHSSELESGWDFTSRFYNKCDQFLPIDLNVYLYKYEADFAIVSSLFNDDSWDENFFKTAANQRKKEINKYLWNEKEGFFYDYGYVYKKQSEFLSLAGFTPLWAELATNEQAKKMVKKLSFFESDHGLIITAKKSLARPIDLSNIQKRYHPAIREIIDPKQWDYPYVWPPLEYLTVIGLLKYGFVEKAAQIMKKSLQANAKIFRTYHTFFEKIDGISGNKGKDFSYSNQQGFSWTNAVFYRYVQILTDLEAGKNIYKQKKPNNSPYSLSILH